MSLPRIHRFLATASLATALLLGGSACASVDPNAGGEDAGGGELVLGVIGNNKDELQPYTPTGSASAVSIRQQLYNGLTTYNADGGVDMELAESMTPNESLDVWTVKLRPDVSLHNGRDFVADDVITSIRDMMDPSSNYPAAAQIDFVDPSKIVALDDLTVEFTLNRPTGVFPDAWASSDLLMRGLDENGEPVGTGPFTVTSFTAGQEARFVRFEEFWGEKPGFERLRMQFFQDQQAITNALRGKQIDVAYSVPFTDVKALTADPEIKTLVSESGGYPTMSMRVDQAPFDDARVREALGLVIDRQQIVDNAYGGYATIANDFLGNNTACPAPDVPQREQDIPRAKELLAEAGQSELSFELVTDGAFPGMMETAQLFAQDAAKAGVTVTVKKLDPATFLNGWGEWSFFLGFSASPYVVTASTHFLPDGVENSSHFSDPSYTELALKMMSTTDPEAQCADITQLQAIEREGAGNLIAAYPQNLIAYRDGIEGLRPDLWGRSAIDYRGVTISE